MGKKNRNWFVTMPKAGSLWESTGIEGIKTFMEEKEAITDMQYCIFCEEQGHKTGYVHYHMYIQFNESRTLTQVKKFVENKKANCQPGRDSEKARDYIKKEGNWMEVGQPKKQGRRSDLDEIREMIEHGDDWADIAGANFEAYLKWNRGMEKYKNVLRIKRAKESDPVMPKLIIFVGPAGSGKSHHCFNYPGFRKRGYRYPIQMHGKCYFDGLNDEEMVWFDEFNGATMSFKSFCGLVDKWQPTVEQKGSCIETFLTHILISTVAWPSTWWDGSPTFLEDPNQLFRRITELWYCRPPVDGSFVEPELLDRRGYAARDIDEYRRLMDAWGHDDATRD